MWFYKILLLISILSSHYEQISAVVCQICGDGEVMTKQGTVNGPVGGSVTCATLEELGAKGTLTEEQCAEIQTLAATPCGCGEYVCPMCGQGWVMTKPTAYVNIPHIGEVTCNDVYQKTQTPGLINATTCPVIQLIVDNPCGCQARQQPTKKPTYAPFNSFPTYPTSSSTVNLPTTTLPKFPTFSPVQVSTSGALGQAFNISFWMIIGSAAVSTSLLLAIM